MEDGILGLSRNSDFLNSLGSPSFSLCFTPDAGYMSFGEDDLAQGPLPVSIRPTGYYALPVSRVHLGSVELQCLAYFNRGKGTVLDSGTTDTYLPADCARSFKTAWRAATGKDFSNTVQNIEHADFEKLPVSVPYRSRRNLYLHRRNGWRTVMFNQLFYLMLTLFSDFIALAGPVVLARRGAGIRHPSK